MYAQWYTEFKKFKKGQGCASPTHRSNNDEISQSKNRNDKGNNQDNPVVNGSNNTLILQKKSRVCRRKILVE